MQSTANLSLLDSLIPRENTGNSYEFGRVDGDLGKITWLNQRVSNGFPKNRNREFIQSNRWFSRDNTETHLRIRERVNASPQVQIPGRI